MTGSTKIKQKSLVSGIAEYLNNKPYIISLSACIVAAYLFFVTHYSISIDDLSRERYILDGYIAAQGRFTGMILSVLFDFFGLNTGILELFGILFLAASAIVFCLSFDCVYTTANKLPQILFSCFFVTFPLHAEVFIYAGCTLSVGAGLFLCAVALWLVLQEAKKKVFSKGTVKNLVAATFLLIIPASWYESVLFVYYSAVFALLVLKLFTHSEPGEFKFKDFITFGLYFAVPLVAAVLSEYLFQTVVLKVWDTDIQSEALNNIHIGNIFSFQGLITLAGTCYKRWIVPMFYYFPITVFGCAVLVSSVLFLVLACKRKNIKYLLAFAGLFSGTVINSLLLMQGAPYRISQAVSFFVAFTVFIIMVLLPNNKGIYQKALRSTVSAVLIVVCVNQITEINYWFNLENIKYENERQAIEQIAYILDSQFDNEKPVVFVGEYTFEGDLKEKTELQKDDFGYKVIASTKDILYKICDKLEGKTLSQDGAHENKIAVAIRKFLERDEGNTTYIIPQALCKSYITWGVDAFNEVNTELLKFFSYIGHDYIQGTEEMYEEALLKAESQPAWPKQGSISDEGEYIVVNFGVESAVSE